MNNIIHALYNLLNYYTKTEIIIIIITTNLNIDKKLSVNMK